MATNSSGRNERCGLRQVAEFHGKRITGWRLWPARQILRQAQPRPRRAEAAHHLQAPIAAAHSVKLAPLSEIKVPVLLVHHKQDGCRLTPYQAMPGLVAALTSAKKVEIIPVDGGSSAGNPCHTGYHQFLGIEGDVTKDIAGWIKRYQSQIKQ